MSAIVSAISAVSSRIATLESRARQLESATYASATAWGAAMNELVDLQARCIALAARQELLQAYAELLESTPAKSGRARAGWTLSTSGHFPEPPPFPDSDSYDLGRVEAAVAEALRNLPEDEFAELRLGNSVEYLPLLEAGLSDQSAGFVARASVNLEARLQRLGRNM